MASEQTMIQQGGKLLRQYTLLYRERYGVAPKINVFKEKYAMKDVVESVGFERAQLLMAYYFKVVRTSHPLDWFKYNFERLDKILDELAEDDARKAKMREETARRVAEWKERNESRSETD